MKRRDFMAAAAVSLAAAPLGAALGAEPELVIDCSAPGTDLFHTVAHLDERDFFPLVRRGWVLPDGHLRLERLDVQWGRRHAQADLMRDAEAIYRAVRIGGKQTALQGHMDALRHADIVHVEGKRGPDGVWRPRVITVHLDRWELRTYDGDGRLLHTRRSA